MIRPLFSSALFALLLAPAMLPAQGFDSSGNSLLHGNYFVRQILFSTVSSSTGAIGRSRSLTGTAAFDGSGHYTFTGQTFDSTDTSKQAKAYTFTGTYSVTSAGLLQLQNPLDTAETIVGGVGTTALVGSSTESNDFDLLVAIPAGASATQATLQGGYRVGTLDFLGGDITVAHNASFLLNADGQGNLSSITVTGQATNLGTTELTQTISGASYALMTGGSGTITLPGPSGATPQSQLVTGAKNLYVSSDGSTILGGSLTGFDILIGIKAFQGSASNASLQGTYYTAGIDDDATSLSSGASYLDGFYGSINANGLGTAIGAERLNPSSQNTYDYTFDDEFTVGTDGGVSEKYTRFYVGAGGKAALLTGRASVYSLQLAVQPLTVPKAGSVYLNPIGVLNTASYAPVTNSISGGEFINLYGTGLSSSSLQAQSLPLPAILGGVQVTINGRAAPIYFVSPTQLVILVPYGTSETYATIVVNNNGTDSNAVMVYTNGSSPGVFTLGKNGVGPGAITHANGSVVSSSNPAHIGETVIAYATGLGAVSPAVADGVAGPSSPLSKVTGVQVFIDNLEGTVSFAGLAPGYVGLYQINVQIPANVTIGDVYFDVSTQDAYTSQGTIAVAR